jgi:molybdenum cofactor biosynthesis protein B
MVDFQSRDTRRGHSDETDDDDDSEEEETEQAEDDASGTEAASEAVQYETDADESAFSYAVVTVTNDGTLDSDPAGDAVVERIKSAGDAVVTRELLTPAYDGVQSSLNRLVDRKDVDAVVTVGGTGVESDDVTVDAATDLFDKHLPGFGELFRLLSHEQEGSAVIRTRATAGVVERVPVFCLPGDPDSARLGVDQIVADEAPELAALASEPAEDEDDEDDEDDESSSSLLS